MSGERGDILHEIADAIMEKPYVFSVGDCWFKIFPETLGKSLLLTRLIASLDVDYDKFRKSPTFEALRIIRSKRNLVCKIIAIHTVNSKADVFDTDLINNRTDYFLKKISDKDLATLILLTLSREQSQSFTKELGIDKDNKAMSKISRIKNKKGNTITFGGKSLYGTLIGSACERFGWTMDYVVWGISYTNLRMLMADAISTIYLTDEERKEARISGDRRRISADDPKNWAKIKSMKWD